MDRENEREETWQLLMLISPLMVLVMLSGLVLLFG